MSMRAARHFLNIKHLHDLGAISESRPQLMRHLRRIQLAANRVQNRLELNLERGVHAAPVLLQLVQERERVRQQVGRHGELQLVRRSVCVRPPLDVDGGRAQLALEECGGLGLVALPPALSPHDGHQRLDAVRTDRHEWVQLRRHVRCHRPRFRRKWPNRVVRDLVPLLPDRPEMTIYGTGEAPDSSETGREALPSEPFREETGRARREKFVGDWFD